MNTNSVWIPHGGLSTEAQAEDLEGFARFRAARAPMGEWGRGTWAVQRAHTCGHSLGTSAG